MYLGLVDDELLQERLPVADVNPLAAAELGVDLRRINASSQPRDRLSIGAVNNGIHTYKITVNLEAKIGIKVSSTTFNQNPNPTIALIVT
jgi:hypothetical protein